MKLVNHYVMHKTLFMVHYHKIKKLISTVSENLKTIVLVDHERYIFFVF